LDVELSAPIIFRNGSCYLFAVQDQSFRFRPKTSRQLCAHARTRFAGGAGARSSISSSD